MFKLAESERRRAKRLRILKVGKAKCVRVYLRCNMEGGNLFDSKRRKNAIWNIARNMQQQQQQRDGGSHEGTGGVSAGATHGLIRAPKVSALPSVTLTAITDAPHPTHPHFMWTHAGPEKP